MNLREIILRNLGWKLLSLALGILLYAFLQARIQGEVILLHRTSTQTFERSVSVLSLAERGGVFHVEPRVVRVEVSGRRDVVRRLSEADIRPFVDLSDVIAATEVSRTVQIQPVDWPVRVEVHPPRVRVSFKPVDEDDEDPEKP